MFCQKIVNVDGGKMKCKVKMDEADNTNKLYLYYTFFSRAQKQDESFLEYYSSVLAVAKACDFRHFYDDFLKVKVVTGLYRRDIRQRLLNVIDSDLDHLIKICLSIDNQSGQRTEENYDEKLPFSDSDENSSSDIPTDIHSERIVENSKTEPLLSSEIKVTNTQDESTKSDKPVPDLFSNRPTPSVPNRSKRRRHYRFKAANKVHVAEICTKSCTICSRDFQRKEDLKLHLATHKKDRYLCYVCGKKLSNISSYKKHMEAHNNKQQLNQCTKCKQTFKSSVHLKKHQTTHYNEDYMFSCKICKKIFKSAASLHGHRLVHLDKRPHRCETCSKCFSTSTKLTIHKRIHTGEKPYVCGVCNKAFNRSSTLTIHNRVHTGAKPYVCDSCGKLFKTTSQLKKHYRVHTGERPYICTICGRGFNQSSHLKTHMIIHKDSKH